MPGESSMTPKFGEWADEALKAHAHWLRQLLYTRFTEKQEETVNEQMALEEMQ